MAHIGGYRLGDVVGSGSFSVVRLGISPNGTPVAFKIIDKSHLKRGKSQWLQLKREAAILRLIEHPHILKLYDIIETPSKLCLVLEYAKRGELFDLIVEQGKLSKKEVLRLTSQIVMGLEYCHEHGISHRDLKPENILLDENYNVKIADFGMAKMSFGMLQTACGSPHYISPEVASGSKGYYDGKISDVWSLGVIIYAMTTGSMPFVDDNMEALLSKIASGKYRIPAWVDPDLARLISSCLTIAPLARISLKDIRLLPAFASTDLFASQKKTPVRIVLEELEAKLRFREAVSPKKKIKKVNELLGSPDKLDRKTINELAILGLGTEDDIRKKICGPDAEDLPDNLYAVLYVLIRKNRIQKSQDSPFGDDSGIAKFLSGEREKKSGDSPSGPKGISGLAAAGGGPAPMRLSSDEGSESRSRDKKESSWFHSLLNWAARQKPAEAPAVQPEPPLAPKDALSEVLEHTLHILLEHQGSRDAFQKYLSQEMQREYLLFWLEVEKFKQVKEENLQHKARRLMQNFVKSSQAAFTFAGHDEEEPQSSFIQISRSSQKQGVLAGEVAKVMERMSLSSKEAKASGENYADWVTPAQQAKRAQQAVFQLMAVNCLPGFLASQQWREFQLELQKPGGEQLLPMEARTSLSQLLQKRVATAETLRGLLMSENKWFQRFVRIAESLPCSLCITDMHHPQQPLVYVNREFEQLTGYKRDQVIGRNCRFLQGPGTQNEIVLYIANEIREQKSVQVMLLNYRASGEEFMNFLSLKPVIEVISEEADAEEDKKSGVPSSPLPGLLSPPAAVSSPVDAVSVSASSKSEDAISRNPSPDADSSPVEMSRVVSNEKRILKYYIGLQFDVSTTGMPGMLYVDAIFRLLPDRV